MTQDNRADNKIVGRFWLTSHGFLALGLRPPAEVVEDDYEHGRIDRAEALRLLTMAPTKAEMRRKKSRAAA